jgi:hypothetical protein
VDGGVNRFQMEGESPIPTFPLDATRAGADRAVASGEKFTRRDGGGGSARSARTVARRRESTSP